MDIGPGMAPGTQLYSMKVFGCEGSTDIVIDALDWALDPNGDGAFGDHLDIVNLSLGSDYAPGDDPQNAVTDKLAEHGVLAVYSAGNNGDLTDTGGSDAVSSISVASSVDSLQQRDGLKVDGPANLAGIVGGQVSVAYDWIANGPTGAPVSGRWSRSPAITPTAVTRSPSRTQRWWPARSPGSSGTTTTRPVAVARSAGPAT